MRPEYAAYLLSPRWRSLRAQVLKRDNGRCRACDELAEHVHHARYPKKLGEEKIEWLYALCADCHFAIHKLTGTSLEEATKAILARKPGSKVIRIADDWRLSSNAARQRAFGGGGGRHRVRKYKEPKSSKRSSALERRLSAQNDELYEIQKRAQEKRQARMQR